MNEPGEYTSGCHSFGVEEAPMWTGDYHWNCNIQAPCYPAWSSDRVELSEPWQHDLLRADGSPFSAAEAAAIRAITGADSGSDGCRCAGRPHWSKRQHPGARFHEIRAGGAFRCTAAAERR